MISIYLAPDLIVEVLSPGAANQRRDREAKLKLYSRRGVREYWIVDWSTRRMDIYRHQDAERYRFATLVKSEKLESPLLPDFSALVVDIFADVP